MEEYDRRAAVFWRVLDSLRLGPLDRTVTLRILVATRGESVDRVVIGDGARTRKGCDRPPQEFCTAPPFH